MANEEYVKILKQGVKAWNKWREKNLDIQINLNKANLIGMQLNNYNFNSVNFEEANLSYANLCKAEMWNVNLTKAILKDAILIDTYLEMANLYCADLSGANLTVAWLRGTNLHKTNFSNANLFRADLQGANIIRTNFENANLSESKIFGISAWQVKLKGANQTDLRITDRDENEPILTVDNLEVAQFIYLLLHNEKIRNVIDTITSKVVLILDRFTTERKAILDAIREELRNKDYSPVLFDFAKPISKNFIETVGTLAHMARFVIADFTDPKIVLQEVPYIVRNITVPVQPLLLEGAEEPVTIGDLKIAHPFLLDIHRYKDRNDLLLNFEEKVIAPAEKKVLEIRKR